MLSCLKIYPEVGPIDYRQFLNSWKTANPIMWRVKHLTHSDPTLVLVNCKQKNESLISILGGCTCRTHQGQNYFHHLIFKAVINIIEINKRLLVNTEEKVSSWSAAACTYFENLRTETRTSWPSGSVLLLMICVSYEQEPVKETTEVVYSSQFLCF